AQGVLTGKYVPEKPLPTDSRAADSRVNVFMMGRSLMANETLEKVQRLTVLAKEASLSMSQFALAWCLRQSNVSSVIIGATKPAQIEENVTASGVKLSKELIERAETILGGNLNSVRA